MWVNVLDAALSVLLVVLLLPRLGIAGYAVVIIVMESFNFFLSLSRLRARIDFTLSFGRAVVLPAVASCFSAFLTDLLFLHEGSAVSSFWLVLRMVFSASAAAVCFLLFRILKSLKAIRRLDKKTENKE